MLIWTFEVGSFVTCIGEQFGDFLSEGMIVVWISVSNLQMVVFVSKSHGVSPFLILGCLVEIF